MCVIEKNRVPSGTLINTFILPASGGLIPNCIYLPDVVRFSFKTFPCLYDSKLYTFCIS